MVKEKNWLIRTSNFQILGPVSKEKIVEFVNKGSLKGDDELTSGNGYWFLVKEKDLLDKYIFGDIPQTFNPITEAPNVLTAIQPSEQTGTHNKITQPTPVSVDSDPNGNLPNSGDLEYPDMNLPASDDLEYPDMELPDGDDLEYPELGGPSGELDLDLIETAPDPEPGHSVKVNSQPAPQVTEDEEEGLLPDEGDLEYPDLGGSMPASAAPQPAPHDIPDDSFDEDTAPTNPHISNFEEDTDPGITPLDTPKISTEKITTKKAPQKVRPKARPKPKQRNDKLLFFLVSIFFIAFLLAAVIFYYKKVLNKPIPFIGKNLVNIIIPSAGAQTAQQSLVKKKAFLNIKN